MFSPNVGRLSWAACGSNLAYIFFQNKAGVKCCFFLIDDQKSATFLSDERKLGCVTYRVLSFNPTMHHNERAMLENTHNAP